MLHKVKLVAKGSRWHLRLARRINGGSHFAHKLSKVGNFPIMVVGNIVEPIGEKRVGPWHVLKRGLKGRRGERDGKTCGGR